MLLPKISEPVKFKNEADDILHMRRIATDSGGVTCEADVTDITHLHINNRRNHFCILFSPLNLKIAIPI